MPLGGELGTEVFLAGYFGGAHFAAAAGVFVATFLVVGFGDDLGDLNAVTLVV